MFALISSPSLFKGRGWGMGPSLPIQNYMDIGKIDVAEQNLSTREVPRPGLRGGGRGGVPLCGARNFATEAEAQLAVVKCHIVCQHIVPKAYRARAAERVR